MAHKSRMKIIDVLTVRLLRLKHGLLAMFVLLIVIGTARAQDKASLGDTGSLKESAASALKQDPPLPIVSAAQTYPKLLVNDRARAFQGYVLAPIEYGGFVHLMDPDGKVVNTWNIDADRARLLPNCDLLVIHTTGWGIDYERWRELRPLVRQYSWDGKVVWEYRAPDVAHHDVQRLPNGNTIFLMREIVPTALLERSDKNQDRPAKYNSSSILEVGRDGKEVWRWQTHAHFDASQCGVRRCEDRPDASINSVPGAFDWTHANTAAVLPENRWYTAGDKRFAPGNVLLMLRNFWTIYLIDRESSKIVWEYSGEKPGDIGPAHEPHMIEPGLPGEGNILIFSNSSASRPKSSEVLELNPITKQVVWRYHVGKKFFSGRSGAATRLSNGNTFISSDKQGRAFEVTPQGEIVWELKSPWEYNRVAKYPRGYCDRMP